MNATDADARPVGGAPAVVRGAAQRLGAYAAGSAVSLVAVALLLRHLGVQDGGRYLTVLSLVMLAGGLTDAGLTTIGVREHVVREPTERAALLGELLGLRIVLTLAGVAGAVVFAALAGYGGPSVAGTAIAGAGLLAQMVAAAAGVGLVAQMRLGAAALCDLVRQVAGAVVIAVLVAAGTGLVPFFCAGLVGGLAGLAATLTLVRGDVPLRPAWRPRRWARLLAEVAPYAAATAVGAVYFRLAIVLVSLVAGATQTGYFATAFRGVEVLIVIPQLLVGSAFPILAHAADVDRARLSAALGRVFDVCLILGLGVALLLAAGAGVVIDVVAGSAFAPAADVLRIQGVGLAATFIAAGWSYAALGLRLHRAVLEAALVALVVNAAGVLVGASTHGALGAAVGTTVAEVVYAALLARAVRRAGVPLSPDRRALPRVLLAGIVAAVPLLFDGLGGVWATLLCLALFTSVLVALKAVPRGLRVS